jgi:hypothetical protein
MTFMLHCAIIREPEASMIVCAASVGRFYQTFIHVEGLVNGAFETALGLTDQKVFNHRLILLSPCSPDRY